MGRQVLTPPVIPDAVFDSNNAKSIQSCMWAETLPGKGPRPACRSMGRVVAAYMVVNCHRPGLDSREKLISAMEGIKKAARLDRVGVISNLTREPNYPADVMKGHKHLETLLKGSGYNIEFLTVHRCCWSAILEQMPGTDVIE